MSTQSNNYTLGRGAVYFGEYLTGTQNARGELYFGNTPEFKVNVTTSNLDHFASDFGIKQKDDSIILQVNRTGGFTTDNVNPDNLGLFFFGNAGITSVSSGTTLSDTFTGVEQGRYYQLGVTTGNPTGLRDVTGVVVTDGAGTPHTYTLTTDYTLDATLGRVSPVVGGGITNATDMHITYGNSAHSISRIVSSDNVIEGQLRYISANPSGAQVDYFMPWVKLSPAGDFSLKTDTWQIITFSAEILLKPGLQAVYLDGRPYTA